MDIPPAAPRLPSPGLPAYTNGATAPTWPWATALPTCRQFAYLRTMAQRIASRVVRKRRRSFTVKQLAKELGVSVRTVYRMEERPLSPTLERYLSLLGYQVAYYPRWKRIEQDKEGEDC